MASEQTMAPVSGAVKEPLASQRRHWPGELNVLAGLIIIAVIFEALGWLLQGQSFLLNPARLQIVILQVSIVGIIAVGVTQVIITGGIDLSSGSIVGGIDSTQDALASMKAGDLKVTVFQDAAGQGKGSVDAAVKLAKGDKVDKTVWIPFQLVTPETMSNFMKKT